MLLPFILISMTEYMTEFGVIVYITYNDIVSMTIPQQNEILAEIQRRDQERKEEKRKKELAKQVWYCSSAICQYPIPLTKVPDSHSCSLSLSAPGAFGECEPASG